MGTGAFNFSGQIVSNGGPDIAAAMMRDFVREGNFETIREWHRLFLPEHFRFGAMDRYGYQKRGKWKDRRGNRGMRTPPLVYTGRSKQMMMGAIRVSGNDKEAKGVMFPPKYFYMYRKAGFTFNIPHPNGFMSRKTVTLKHDDPDKAAEATRVTAQEAQVLAYVHRDAVTRQIREIRETRTITVA